MKRQWVWCMLLAGCVTALSACKSTSEGANQEIAEIGFDKESVSEQTTKTEKPEETNDIQSTEANRTSKGYPKIQVKGSVKKFDGTIQIADTAYELYNYVESSAKQYATVVNTISKKLGSSVNVYDMIVPTSVGITLPDNQKKKVNSSDQKKSIRKIYHKLHSGICTVSLYETLMQHRTEYIYFRTDHHWTDLGAYYAYKQFCEDKGITPHARKDYTKKNFGGYYGSFYQDTHQSKMLKKDKVIAYYPVDQKKITMKYTDDGGNTYSSPVICDASSYSTSLKYCAFIAGDNPYTVIKNKTVHDGSSCVIVKESFGNAFAPYLADHYQTIYVIDYRYWDGSLSKLVKKKKVQDVLFLNNISMTRNAYLIGKLAQLH